MKKSVEERLVDQLVAVDEPKVLARSLEQWWEAFIISDGFVALTREEREDQLTNYKAFLGLCEGLTN